MFRLCPSTSQPCKGVGLTVDKVQRVWFGGTVGGGSFCHFWEIERWWLHGRLKLLSGIVPNWTQLEDCGKYVEWMNSYLGCTDTPFLASCRCRTPVRVRLAWFRCPASVSFFFFFCFSDTALTRLRRGSDTPALEKKKNHRCLTSHLCPLPLPSVARRS